MTRIRRIEQIDRIFFVTFNVARNVRDLSTPERDLVLEILAELRSRLGFLLLGYCVMPDHVHLLLWPKLEGVTRITRDLKSISGHGISRRRGQRGAIWQPSFFDFICRRARDVSLKLKYIHENPVQAGFVKDPGEWDWSSHRFYAKTGPCSIQPDIVEFSGNPNESLLPNW